jgi:Cyclic nucleotide-binding domain
MGWRFLRARSGTHTKTTRILGCKTGLVEKMDLGNLDLVPMLSEAGDNVTKLLIQLGLDPSKVTFDALYNRLAEIAANLSPLHLFILGGSIFYVATLLMRTIVPLRICNIISDLFFLTYGLLVASISTIILYLLLLPINSVRLYQMIRLVKKARTSAQGDLSMDWLKPFMTPRKYRQGDVVFRKGDAANDMFLTVTGKFLVTELGIELPPGRFVGELGFLSPNNRRTQSVECIEDGQVLTITYDKLLELYFQNPEFGYYFLRLTSDRLLQNIARLEAVIEQNKASLQAEVERGRA